MSNLSYSAQNAICESNFKLHGPFWHLYTNGQTMQNIFCSKEDFKIGLIALAISLIMCKSVKLLAFELMSNHIHLILSGTKEECMELFNIFYKRLRLIYSKLGRAIDWNSFKADILPIDSLDSLRNEIIYTHRNAYVANGNFNPFSYPWGSGCAYFNHWTETVQTIDFKDLPLRIQRELTHSRDVAPYGHLRMCGDNLFIPSFCSVKLGESMFTDSRSYFNLLTRKAEAYSAIATRLKDSVFLTDDEIFHVTLSYCREKSGVANLSLLSPEQRIEVAREIHFKYKATHQQIRRLLRLDTNLLNEILA